MITESLDKSGNIDHIDKSDIENRGINNIGSSTLTKTNNKVLKPVSTTYKVFDIRKFVEYFIFCNESKRCNRELRFTFFIYFQKLLIEYT